MPMFQKVKILFSGRLKPGDFVVFAAILVLAAALMAFNVRPAEKDSLYVEIWRETENGRERVYYGQLLDSTDRVIDVDGHNTVELKGKTARMAYADCRDQVCVRTGTLTRAGQTAVCLPNRVVVRLTGTDMDADAIVS